MAKAIIMPTDRTVNHVVVLCVVQKSIQERQSIRMPIYMILRRSCAINPNGLAMKSSRKKELNYQTQNNLDMEYLKSKYAQIKACFIAFVCAVLLLIMRKQKLKTKN